MGAPTGRSPCRSGGGRRPRCGPGDGLAAAVVTPRIRSVVGVRNLGTSVDMPGNRGEGHRVADGARSPLTPAGLRRAVRQWAEGRLHGPRARTRDARLPLAPTRTRRDRTRCRPRRADAQHRERSSGSDGQPAHRPTQPAARRPHNPAIASSVDGAFAGSAFDTRATPGVIGDSHTHSMSMKR